MVGVATTVPRPVADSLASKLGRCSTCGIQLPNSRVKYTSTLLKTVVGYFCPSGRDHPRLLIVKQCQCSPPIPASGPVFTRI